ncbi:MAG: 50S ribosomal protein L30 [SAR202 cluster bacterium Casp-Chloro-G4]|nr:50S ribosomal protein L30 [Chloroflexota bacterium]MDA1228280.1 50S ribosomal protein L30 [Chloroflexota bacterium]PKB61411.1 MAG: 50S ribosomal protein L30 [SAR202 cluster bacterium Casp-Chloro-G4]
MAKISVTWKVSGIGYKRDQRLTIEALGLRKLHQTVVHDDTPSIMGMLHKVRHLVVVQPAE